MEETEGKAPFTTNGKTYETYYKIFGDLRDPSKPPLFILHGGPQAGHEYLLSLNRLQTHHGSPVIFYDQLGCGASSAPVLADQKARDETFWSVGLFCEELSNLIAYLGLEGTEIDLLGHSRGGMLAVEWAAKGRGREKLRRLVLYSSLASVEGHVRGLEDRWVLGTPFPFEEVRLAFERMAGLEAHKVLWGPHMLAPTGVLKDWTSIPYLDRIRAPTMVVRGSKEYIQETAMQPFFDLIPKVEWVTVDCAAHFAHIVPGEEFFEQVERFLAD